MRHYGAVTTCRIETLSMLPNMLVLNIKSKGDCCAVEK